MLLIISALANIRLRKGNQYSEQAKSATGDKASKLLEQACTAYESVVETNGVVQKALYHWGLALFDQAQLARGKEKGNLCRRACEKFSAAWVVDPSNPRIANDWGAALMQQARDLKVAADDALYSDAHERFQAAERLQPGLASYNLACIHSLRCEYEECKKRLKTARDLDTLPSMEDVKNDADLGNITPMAWFQEFLQPQSENLEPKDPENVSQASEKAVG